MGGNRICGLRSFRRYDGHGYLYAGKAHDRLTPTRRLWRLLEVGDFPSRFTERQFVRVLPGGPLASPAGANRCEEEKR